MHSASVRVQLVAQDDDAQRLRPVQSRRKHTGGDGHIAAGFCPAVHNFPPGPGGIGGSRFQLLQQMLNSLVTQMGGNFIAFHHITDDFIPASQGSLRMHP